MSVETVFVWIFQATFTLWCARMNLWPTDPPLSPTCNPLCCASTLCMLELGIRWQLAQRNSILFSDGLLSEFGGSKDTQTGTVEGQQDPAERWTQTVWVGAGFWQGAGPLFSCYTNILSKFSHLARNFHDHTWPHSSHSIPCRREKQEREERGEVRVETHFWILLPSSLLPLQHRGNKVVLHASLWLPYIPSIMLVQFFVQLCSQSDPEMA